MKRVHFGLLAALTLFAPFAGAGTVQLNIEEPAPSTTYNGVANIRGWTFSTVAMKAVKLAIDGGDFFDLPVGGQRHDVAIAFPDYPNAGSSGFSMAYSYQRLGAGAHSLTVRAEDVEGAVAERSVSFNVVRFDSDWIAGADSVDTSNAIVSIDGDSIRISNLYVDGVAYDTVLDWRNAIQGYTFSAIDPVGEESPCYSVRRLLGAWDFYVDADKTYNFSYEFYAFNETPNEEIPCVAWAEDADGDVEVMGWADPNVDVLYVHDKVDEVYDWYYEFAFDSTDRISGGLYIFEDGDYASTFDMAGVRDSASLGRMARGAARSGGANGDYERPLSESSGRKGQGSSRGGDLAAKAEYLRELVRGVRP